MSGSWTGWGNQGGLGTGEGGRRSVGTRGNYHLVKTKRILGPRKPRRTGTGHTEGKRLDRTGGNKRRGSFGGTGGSGKVTGGNLVFTRKVTDLTGFL